MSPTGNEGGSRSLWGSAPDGREGPRGLDQQRVATERCVCDQPGAKVVVTPRVHGLHCARRTLTTSRGIIRKSR
jgi:hypothetical protein